MKKQILAYKAELERELARLEAISDPAERTVEAAILERAYAQKISDFRHERLVHLFIMLFFAAVTAAVIIAIVLLPYFLPADAEAEKLLFGFGGVSIILIVLDIFYIAHYYFLENSVQALYLYEERIFTLLRQKD